MLEVTIPARELFDDDKQIFIPVKEEKIQLEHSLVSLSKWESKWCKPFLGKDKKTTEEVIDYIRCMTITQHVPSEAYSNVPDSVYNEIRNYIDAPMTATWFNNRLEGNKSREIVTAEIIYHLMIINNVPMECQKWHLNRLLTLLKVCSIKNSPPQKMNRQEMLTNRKALNDARRKRMKSKG